MRTPAELIFRARQEVANLRLRAVHPSTHARPAAPLPGLPDPDEVAARLKGTPFAVRLQTLAQSILQHHFPLPGGTVSTGPHIEWRRDYRNNIKSPASYFRLVRYLDFTRVGDHKVIWDLNRHQHLVVLAQAHLFTGRRELLVEIEDELASWTAANPYMHGINWTSALEVAFRALSWLWVYHLVGRHLSNDAAATLIDGLYRHGRYLEHNLSIYFAPNTHLLGEAVALHALGALLPFDDSERWKRKGAEVTAQQMHTQVRDDGSHFEQSSYYHVYALDFFLLHRVLSAPGPWFDAKLASMTEYLDALIGPTRILPLIGDDDGGRVFHPYGNCEHYARATVATSSVLLGDTRWAYADEDLHEQAAWWVGVSGPAKAGHHQSHGSRLFFDAGLGVMASKRFRVLADAGGFGRGSAGHSHSDALSIVVRDGEEEILCDAGTYTYVADAGARNCFRSSAAHNTVRLDGRDQAIPVNPFKWIEKAGVALVKWASAADEDQLEAVCRYRGPGRLSHRRAVRLWRSPIEGADLNLVIVADRIEGSADLHLVEQYWHPGEPFTVMANDQVRIGTQCSLHLPGGAQFEVEDQWRSRVFGEKFQVQALVVRRTTQLPVTLWAVLSAGKRELNLSLQIAGEEAHLHVDGVTFVLWLDAAGHLRSSRGNSSTR